MDNLLKDHRWPILNRPPDVYTDTQERSVFDSIVELSGALREAQITVYSVAPGWLTNYTLLYKSYLKGVRTFREADFGNLALKVLATQTGGEIFGPDNDLVEQMNRCVADANAYYRISFDPPHAAHADEYHDLKVGVDKPGVVVRTTTGYYDQPPAN